MSRDDGFWRIFPCQIALGETEGATHNFGIYLPEK